MSNVQKRLNLADVVAMQPIRVMIVDDSVVIRRLLSDALTADPRIEIAATAVNGRLALAKLDAQPVDVVVLDIEMPELDGLQTLREIRKRNRRLPVIMFSTLSERGARITLEALSAGASDYVTKPSNVGSIGKSMTAIREELIPRIIALTGRHAPPPPVLPPTRPVVANRPAGAAITRPRVLLIGSSTGGPDALCTLIPALPGNLDVPVLIVQHMPAVFTTMLAERLNRLSPLTVVEAAGGERLLPGSVYLAPGGQHLQVRTNGGRDFSTGLSSAEPENFCRPSVDVLFRSGVAAYGPAVLAVILTGMGSDGAAGSELIVHAGGSVLAQDRESSVVWGMPGAVAGRGLAEQVLPLNQLAAAVTSRLGRRTEPITHSPVNTERKHLIAP